MSTTPTPTSTPNPLIEGLKGAKVNLSSHDMALNRAGFTPLKTIGKYDKGLNSSSYESNVHLNPQTAQEYFRGATQTRNNKLWKGFLGAVGSVPLKVGQGAAHVEGFLADV